VFFFITHNKISENTPVTYGKQKGRKDGNPDGGRIYIGFIVK
jgi:hypothetical protein